MFLKWLILFVFVKPNLSSSKLIHDVLEVCKGVYIVPETLEKELVQPYILNPISKAEGNYWLMSPNLTDPMPYFAITKMSLNDQSFLVFARLTNLIIEQAKVNFGQIQLDSLTMFNFVLALSKKCIRNGETPSLAMDKNYIVADTQHLQGAIQGGAIFDPLKAKAVLIPKDFLDGTPAQKDSILVLYEFNE